MFKNNKYVHSVFAFIYFPSRLAILMHRINVMLNV